ncbi:ankyrin repeat domain-containing 60-like [Paramuricea clavata]|uniref:Ankyrin repeat domain-containing 60-like n=1 Tax=Paramuricea clavata TaxID=317549 RepID=A0A6S7FL57_PARCT|nr:ankyrin repeat domain-containing 60-like [Paramuricea clavata]
MEDYANLSFYHLTPNAVIKMCFWPEWRPLIRAVCKGDLQAVLSCGISARKLSNAAARISYRIEPSAADKGSVALFIASHRGHNEIVQALMNANVRAFEAQPSDRTPLLMAAKNSRVETVDLLLGRTRCVARARSNQYDTVRERALKSLVALLEKKGACKKLWFTMNQAKLNKMKRESHPNNRLLRQHQMHDSRTPVWIKGNCREVGSKRGSQGGETLTLPPKYNHNDLVADFQFLAHRT